MTRDQMLSDLYARLTSRKFLAFVLTIGFAIWNFYAGRLDAVQFQQAIWLAATAYGVVEGASDFAAALRPAHKAPDAVVTTNVDASPAPTATTEPPVATVRPKRVRPSRAKVKTETMP